ncbi:MAG: C45 family autoproteolytic acyltransferase/hydrolase [Salinisphaera sp.]|jgi:isopenicillin-N N-acyltransferase-like protein|nr:C45 family autoproteolytic acyltransferase/hydrolase [Salinisphaera sp.]
MQLDVLSATGSPAAFGRLHGEHYRDAIRRFAAERVQMAGDSAWVGRDVPRTQVIELAEACLESHRHYAPTLVDELDEMALATDLSSAELLVASGFTDFMDTAHATFAQAGTQAADVDDCTAMIVPGSRTDHGAPLFAQTWDMHETATDHVFMLDAHPAAAPSFKTFTSMGCLGMIGMNDAGVTIGINNLSGGDGRVGVTWNFVVRKVLAQTNFESALACIAEVRLAGAHNYLLLGPDDRGRFQGANIEAMATAQVVTRLADEPLIHTNHCLAEPTLALERPRLPASQRNSEQRLARAHGLLDDAEQVSTDTLAQVTRDRQAICYPPTPALRMTTCGAVLADPARGELWALRGRPSQQRYQRFTVGAGRD